jgi:hypothetical protein
MKMQYDINVRLIDHFSQIINLDNETVFIIDDCVYSGTQIAKDYFDTTEYDEWQQINSMQNEDDDTIFNEIKVYFLISYVSNLGKTNIINAYENHPLFNQYEYVWPEHVEIIEPVTNYISYEELIQLYRYYDPKVEIINLYPIYFDHKLASSSSTLTELYLGIVPNSNNLEVIKNYNETGNSFLLQKLIIYPIISNCDKIKINDLQNELKSPSCPFSPYKEEGIKYIENNVIFSNPKKRQHSVVSPVKSSTKLQKI